VIQSSKDPREWAAASSTDYLINEARDLEVRFFQTRDQMVRDFYSRLYNAIEEELIRRGEDL